MALTGIQSAGKALAAKGSFNIAIEQATATAKRLLRLKPSGHSIQGVHSSLSSSAEKLSYGSAIFHQAVQSAIIRHRKKISDGLNQILCKRVAECAIDLFSVASVLSRATKALNEGSETAQHEKLLAETWTMDAIRRVESNVHFILNEDATTDKSYYKIADEMLDAGEYKPKHVI